MKCPKCEGTGEMQICEMGFIGKDECDECHGKGYLTNEEWFCELPTKEKAKFLAAQQLHGGTIASRSDVDWEEWLKEKHNG